MSDPANRDLLTLLMRACALLGVYAASLAAGAGAATSSSDAVAFGSASAGSVRVTRCSQLNEIASIFPVAKRVGFIKRDAIKRERARGIIWPGWCGRRSWWTTYTARTADVDVSVALYASAHDVGAALAECACGPVQVQLDGSRVRMLGPVAVYVNGVSASNTVVISAYRNLFISSTSISTAKTAVPVAAQLRIHRAIEGAFRSLR